MYSHTTHQNERREGLIISAPDRDAAYSELNRRGIRLIAKPEVSD